MTILLLLLVSAYVAWQYSKTEVDPDWALFNMAAFTGSWYGRDFADCKPPAIHLWYWAIAKVVGENIQRVRFAHHFVIGAGGSLLAVALTGNFWAGLVFAVLVNSAWLYAFHGNVGQPPALLLLVALGVDNPWIAALAMGAACFFEPKLIASLLALVVIKAWYPQAAIYGIIALTFWFILPKEWRTWTWEGSFTIPKLMGKQRVAKVLYVWTPWFTAETMLYILPWLFVAVLLRPDWVYWLPAFLYLIMVGYSKAMRQNHMLPLAAWIAMAGMPWIAAAALVAWDFISSGFYAGDIWKRHYGALWQDNIDAREIGEYLRQQPGTLWVNDYHTGIYVHARKPCKWHMTEQAEMNTILVDRRVEFIKTWHDTPPDLIVQGKKCGARFDPAGYRVVAKHKSGKYEVYRKI